MNTASTKLKSLILPLVIKFTKGDINALPDSFWNQFANDFIHYESDATPVYTALYKLELKNPESVFEKLPKVFSSFIKEFAEEYVLGNESEITTKLLESNNEAFLKEVSFLKTMQAVITKLERQDLKKNLPLLHERLLFDLDEETLKQVVKKKSREDLTAKFEQWDEELEENEVVLMEANHSLEIVQEEVIPSHENDVSEPKVISLNWAKYVTAACIVFAMGIFFFRNTNPNIESNNDTIVTTEVKKDSTQTQINTPIKEVPTLADVETISKEITIHQEESLGFSEVKKQKITIVFNDATQRIASIEKYVTKSSSLEADEMIALQKSKEELADLKKLSNTYTFTSKTVTLFGQFNPKIVSILVIDHHDYFFKYGSDFYNIKTATSAIPLQKVSDAATIEILEKISFDNE